MDPPDRVFQHGAGNEERGDPREVERLGVLKRLGGRLTQVHAILETGRGDLLSRERQRGLPGIDAHHLQRRPQPAHRDRQHGDTRADIEKRSARALHARLQILTQRRHHEAMQGGRHQRARVALGHEDALVLVIPAAAAGTGDEIGRLREEALDDAKQRHRLVRVQSLDGVANAQHVEDRVQSRGQLGLDGRCERGISPTEEEFQEARDLGIDVLVLVHDGVDREPAQQEFLARVRGTWEQGNFTANFTGPGDVALAAVKTLNAWQRGRAGADPTPAAVARALELARGDERRGMIHGGSNLRVVVTPVLNGPLIGAVELADRSRLLDPLSGAARASGLVPQSMGIETSVEADRLRLTAQGAGETLSLIVGFDGSVVGEGEVGGETMGLGGMMVRADRARDVITRTGEFAQRVWQAIDTRDEVRNILLAAAVPEAEHKSWVEHDPGNSMSMPMSMPHVLIAPEQPLRARRADLDQPGTLDRLHAELRRAFELAGAVQQRNPSGF